MAKRGKRSTGRSIVDLARLVERGKKRIEAIRHELARETAIVAEFLGELRHHAEGLVGVAHRGGSARSGRAGSVKTGAGRIRGRGGQRDAIVEFVKGKDEPQPAEAIAGHVGNKVSNVRQALIQMVKAGTLASYKKDGNAFRLPKKGERGGLYGLPK